MRRMIKYTYDSWTESCGCCSNSSSTYDVWEDGILVQKDIWCDLFESEEDLRDGLKFLEPFDVHSECEYF